MSTLFARLSLLFAFVLLCLGGGSWVIAYYSQQRYFDESSQIQSQPVAMYMASQVPLFADGQPDATALQDLARHVMMINPSLEVYLLNESGAVIASAAHDSALLNRRVDLAPVHRFLSPDVQMPVYGDDPKRPGEQRVFSVFPVGNTSRPESGCELCGYVYVVLGGASRESMWQSLTTRYSVQFSTMLLAGVLFLTLALGIALFFMLTKPLRRLTSDMSKLQLPTPDVANQSTRVIAGERPTQGYNELKVLEQACHKMADRIAHQYEALDQADKRRRDFMTRVSHDLRTPLTSLCGAIETVVDRGNTISPAERQEYLVLAQRQGARLQRLISQVFDLARLDSNDVTLDLESLSLLELLMDIVQDLQIQARARAVELRVEYEDSAKRIVVQADMLLLHRVLENLLVNAIRYTPASGRVTITIRREASNQVCTIIEDTGCGFSQTLSGVALSRVCHRGGMLANSQSQGTGLGLGIVAGILALHGSTAHIWSKPGKGTRVEFYLMTSNTNSPVTKSAGSLSSNH